jgi:large-conductance mechanosensitive channel
MFYLINQLYDQLINIIIHRGRFWNKLTRTLERIVCIFDFYVNWCNMCTITYMCIIIFFQKPDIKMSIIHILQRVKLSLACNWVIFISLWREFVMSAILSYVIFLLSQVLNSMAKWKKDKRKNKGSKTHDTQ